MKDVGVFKASSVTALVKLQEQGISYQLVTNPESNPAYSMVRSTRFASARCTGDSTETVPISIDLRSR